MTTAQLRAASFAKRKTVKVPEWAKAIYIIGNGIDGYPPHTPVRWAVDDFLARFDSVQCLDTGGGEWDLLVYALDDLTAEPATVAPYGRDNPYRRCRSRKGCRVKLLAQFSYMHSTCYNFVR